ncbi:transcription factor bHLH18-like protein, partial [Tanacetum coccineum]
DMQDQSFMNHEYQMIKPYHLVPGFGTIDSFSTGSNINNPSFVDHEFQIPKSINDTSHVKRQPIYKMTNDTVKKLTTDEHLKPKPMPISSNPSTFTISFGDLKPKDEVITLCDSFGNTPGMKKGTVIRNRIQLQDHMLAERKRREKLSRGFISLSSLLPDLKKMDKATVLEDAANYIQVLECRVKELEGLPYLKTSDMEMDIAAKRPKLSFSDNDCSLYDEANVGANHIPHNPEIKVRISGSSVLVRILCQKDYVSLVNAISEMEKLGLSVSSSSALPFTNIALLINIVAKKTDDFSMTSSDLVKTLKRYVSF